MTETSLTFQYVFHLWGPWRPYLGAGVGLAYFITSSTSDAAKAIGVNDLKSDVGFGLVGQVGVAYRLNKTWILNFDVKYFNIPMEVELRSDQGTSPTVEMDWQPPIIGLGTIAEIGRELNLLADADRRRLWKQAGALLLEGRPG